MSERTSISYVWAAIVGWSLAAIAGFFMLVFWPPVHESMRQPMCIDPSNEQTQVASSDPVSNLLAAIDAARPYAALHTANNRRRLKQAGMTNLPPFDAYSRVIADLRNALAVVTHAKTLTPQ